ncbi:L,D-transpeptidase family protein [Demequina capsici]|uniref:L,D-transpeptidase family protein n=1 Tax=Demequina capsici TaxID=3075620 RepID=A0AA96F8U7_9MICO|nr:MULTISPECIES: L,D-transpeptidase family protein [unclassified Demequina]WNM24887.1 L,D-transpeptidase family protein [Demequina sp. OYTSA14]WNM27793.1 L,D-transpeptidase family protein [Demequina sp. PMTSA13]
MRLRSLAATATAAIVAVTLAGCYVPPTPDEIEALHASFVASQSATPSITAEGPIVTYSPDPVEEETHLSYIATANESAIDVYTEPNGDVQQTIAAADVLTVPDSTPLTFLVETRATGWYQVYLPVRPNGTTGWVRADDVSVTTTNYWVEVDITHFTLTAYLGTVQVFQTAIGVGRDDRPTPGGVYYIRELLQVPDPQSIYGPYAYGLSGFQPVLDEFNGGEAIIGMHGTNDPSSIGKYVSSGCIRMPNDAITELATEVGLPLGTPVYIDQL